MTARYLEITAIIDEFCAEKLNSEYAELGKQMTAALARKRPSPLVSGKAKTWACGIVYAIGFVNFIFDKSQEPHLQADELCAWFGVAVSTGGNKSKQIRDLLKITHFDSTYMLPDMIENTSLAWLITVDGFLLDARNLPRAIQEEAFQKGLIPYIYADRI